MNNGMEACFLWRIGTPYDQDYSCLGLRDNMVFLNNPALAKQVPSP